MEEEIEKAAGAIWKALSTKGELSLSQLKKATKGKPPIFDWGYRLAGARRQDRDHAREALVPCPTKGGTGKCGICLLGLIVSREDETSLR